VTLVGYAQSNARVSTLMRHIEASPWVGQPELVEIKAGMSPSQKDTRVNEFVLSFKVKRAPPPATPAGAPAKGAPPAKASPAAPAPAPKGAKA
jgi:type IV pilus assembly protein PilN